LVSVDCGGGVGFLVPQAEAEGAEAKLCPSAAEEGLVQAGRRVGGGANATGGQAASYCPIHKHNTYCGPRYDWGSLTTLDGCYIVTQNAMFWGNSCSRYYYWRGTTTANGKEYGPCRCCRYDSAGVFYWYTSSVGNNVYTCR